MWPQLMWHLFFSPAARHSLSSAARSAMDGWGISERYIKICPDNTGWSITTTAKPHLVWWAHWYRETGHSCSAWDWPLIRTIRAVHKGEQWSWTWEILCQKWSIKIICCNTKNEGTWENSGVMAHLEKLYPHIYLEEKKKEYHCCFNRDSDWVPSINKFNLWRLLKWKQHVLCWAVAVQPREGIHSLVHQWYAFLIAHRGSS
jgi:hypothetical protein